MAKGIRWKQRFENLERAFSFLEKAVRLIREDYFPAIKQVYHKLRNERDR